MKERYKLTPWGCLTVACMDFGIDLPEISGETATALMDDFFAIMEIQGILEKKEED